jgi:hypothetical protein
MQSIYLINIIAGCYGLDGVCLPKIHMVKAWFPELHYWEVLVPLRDGANWEVVRSLEL